MCVSLEYHYAILTRLQCFKRIYSLPESIKLIAIMGDNDIGGEGDDLVNDVVLR